jgi:hypothetical protein
MVFNFMISISNFIALILFSKLKVDFHRREGSHIKKKKRTEHKTVIISFFILNRIRYVNSKNIIILIIVRTTYVFMG